MAFEEVNHKGRPLLRHPGAVNARGGTGGFFTDDNKFSIYGCPFTRRGDEVDTYELIPQFTAPILRVTGAPFAPLIELTDGTKVKCEAGTLDGLWSGGLQQVHTIPVGLLVDRGDGWAVAKSLEVVGNVTPHLQPELTAQEIINGDIIRPDDIVWSLAFYADMQNNAHYEDGTSTLAETGKSHQIRAPEIVFRGSGGQEISRKFSRWYVRYAGDRTFIDKLVKLSDIPVGALTIETAATLGYQTVGATDLRCANDFYTTGEWEAPEDGDITAFDMTIRSAAATGFGVGFAIYNSVANAATTVLWEVSGLAAVVQDPINYNFDLTSEGKSIVSGSKYSFALGDQLSATDVYVKADAATSRDCIRYDGASFTDNPTLVVNQSGFTGHGYITYTASAAAVIPQIMNHRRQMAR